MYKNLNKKFKESFFSIFPVVLIVFAVSLFLVDISGPLLVKLAISSVLLFFGMSFFTLGADTAMIPIGQNITSGLTKTKKILVLLLACFVMGVVITIAEPDIAVLANQIPSINKWILIFAIGLGVGVCFVLGVVRILFKIPFKWMLLCGYAICFVLLIFVPKSFWAIAFDSSGVTTGAISVPFIMSFGLGLSAMRSGKSSEEDGFGLIAICSIGPILSVLILGLFSNGVSSNGITVDVSSTYASIPADYFASFKTAFLDSAIVILPIALIFLVFQLTMMKLPRNQVLKILMGLVFTYLGISVFLTGVNAGFADLGLLLGKKLAEGNFSWALYPLALVLGYVIVQAEPAVHVLSKQVADVSENTISKRVLKTCLSIGVAISLLIAVLRAQFEINILYFVIPIFSLSIILSFYNPKLFTAVAFDSGGIASGIMSVTFLLPFVQGVAFAFGSDPFIGAFGTIALFASVPILVVQILGAIAKFTRAKRLPAVQQHEEEITILEFDY